jgi:hypothetical protein
LVDGDIRIPKWLESTPIFPALVGIHLLLSCGPVIKVTVEIGLGGGDGLKIGVEGVGIGSYPRLGVIGLLEDEFGVGVVLHIPVIIRGRNELRIVIIGTNFGDGVRSKKLSRF